MTHTHILIDCVNVIYKRSSSALEKINHRRFAHWMWWQVATKVIKRLYLINSSTDLLSFDNNVAILQRAV